MANGEERRGHGSAQIPEDRNDQLSRNARRMQTYYLEEVINNGMRFICSISDIAPLRWSVTGGSGPLTVP
jgi:hypothetical protein